LKFNHFEYLCAKISKIHITMCRKIFNLKPFKFVLLLASVYLLSSCITSRKLNYLQDSSMKIPSYADTIGYEEYTIMPTDKLFIRIYSPDQSINSIFNGSTQGMGYAMSGSDYSDLYTYQVKDDGTIKLPIVDELYVQGLSIREAKRKIESSIQSTMVDKCAVDVRVVGRYYSVIGAGTNGRYPILREKMNIFQALALAGDISTFGDRGSIKILRESPNGTSIRVFDIRSKDIINSEFYYVQPNDVIYIQDMKNQFFSVTSLGSALSTTFSTISFGVLIYNMAMSAQKQTTSTENSAE